MPKMPKIYTSVCVCVCVCVYTLIATCGVSVTAISNIVCTHTLVSKLYGSPYCYKIVSKMGVPLGLLRQRLCGFDFHEEE